jgi:hypothetical protein
MAPTRGQVIGAVNNIAIQYNFAAMSVAIGIMGQVSASHPLIDAHNRTLFFSAHEKMTARACPLRSPYFVPQASRTD